MSQPDDRKDVQPLLDLIDEVSEKHHIEYGDWRHAHMQQHMVAQYHLGSSVEETINAGKADMERSGYEPRRDPDPAVMTEETYRENFGTDIPAKFSSFLNFFHKETKVKKWADVVAERAPLLLEGMVGGLNHGAIHLGMGIEGFVEPNETMIAEGLAWMANAYMPMSPMNKAALHEPLTSQEGDQRTLIKYVVAVAERALKDKVSEELQVFGKKPEYTDKHLHPAVKQVRCFSGQLCPELDFHKVLDLDDWKPIAMDEDVDKVTEHVATVCAAMYLCAGPEFYVLHAVTGWWAIRFILPYLKDDDARFDVVAHFIRGALAVYIERFMPGVEKLPAVLEDLAEGRGELFQRHDAEPADKQWKEIIEQATRIESDAHQTKVIHALYEDWKRYGYQEVFYRAAAQHLSSKIYFSSKARQNSSGSTKAQKL